MRHSHLRAFHHVALHKGFSRAAEALHQTQPALSEQVRRLEQKHDVLLFNRDHRQVKLTDAGEALFRLTQEYFEMEHRIAAQLGASRAAVAGRLRIVADSAHHITNMLSLFRAKHQSVQITLKSGNSEDVMSSLRAYSAEIGVVGNAACAADVDSYDLGGAPIIAIAGREFPGRPDRPVMLCDLRDHPLIFRERGSRTRSQLEDAANAQRIHLEPAIEVEGREAMREVVASGAGIGFISDAEVGNDDRIVRIPLMGDGLDMRERLVVLRSRRDVPVIRAFLASAGFGAD